MKINDARLKYEQRKLTQYLRDRYNAEHKTLNIDGQDYRTWRAPVDMIRSKTNTVRTGNFSQNYEHNNSDTLKSDSEKNHIRDMAHKKRERERAQKLEDEKMQKLQQAKYDDF